MKAIIYFPILFFTLFLLACSSDSIEKSPDEGITLKFGQQQSISYLGQNYDLLIYDVNSVFSDGYSTEDKTGLLTTSYKVGLIVDNDSLEIQAVTSVREDGQRNLQTFETLSKYPASHNYVKSIGSLQIAVSDVYQEPKKDLVNNENYKVKLLFR